MVIKEVKITIIPMVKLPIILYLLLRTKNIKTGRIQISKEPTKDPVSLTILSTAF
jgi:hypothetical protein